jgi:hypothetical protein
MSSSRSAKYEKEYSSIQKAEPIEVEKALIGMVTNTMPYVYSDEVVPDVVYPAAALKNIINTNGYAKLCINRRAESTCGKGFNEIDKPEENLYATDKYIIENVDTAELVKTEKNALTYGRFFWDVNWLKGVGVIGIYNVPALTILKGAKNRSEEFVQYFGTDKEKWYPALDLDSLKNGTLKTGHYIFMWKNEDEVYGEPEWIAGQMELLISKEQRRTILSHFLNNADPDGIMMHYGIGGNADVKMIDQYIAKREKFTQGSEKRGKTDHVFKTETKNEVGTAVEYLKIDKELFSAVLNQFMFANKLDTCAFFSMPAFLVNLKSLNGTGGLGESHEMEAALYISETVQPAQRQRYYEPFKLLFPNMNVQLNTMQMPKTTQKANSDITIEKAAYSTIEKALNMNAELRYNEKKE